MFPASVGFRSCSRSVSSAPCGPERMVERLPRSRLIDMDLRLGGVTFVYVHESPIRDRHLWHHPTTRRGWKGIHLNIPARQALSPAPGDAIGTSCYLVSGTQPVKALPRRTE